MLEFKGLVGTRNIPLIDSIFWAMDRKDILKIRLGLVEKEYQLV